MELKVTLPDIQPFAGLNESYLKEMLIATLYHLGKLSAKEAHDVLGMPMREFEELLPKFSYSILNDASKELRPYGLCAGEFTVPEDFDAPLPQDILKDFTGR